MRKRSTTTLLTAGGLLAAAACLWFVFAPVALGGSDTYVVTEGISMQPRFHSGDLAIVRAQPSYRVGEVVAYRSTALHMVVLHRIIAREGDRYTFKGDNNNFIDIERPARSQLLGALWIHVPGVGKEFASLGSPLAVALLVGFGTLLLVGTAAGTRRMRARERRRQGHEQLIPRRAEVPPSVVSTAALACLVVLVPAVIVALVAYTRPERSRTQYNIAYQQNGRISYYAFTPPSSAYPTGVAHTGDPLFTRLVRTVRLRFGYTFRTAASHSVAGTIGLNVDLASTNGWHRTISLQDPKAFSGDNAVAVAPLDLQGVVSAIASLEKDTGVTGSYTLTIRPVVSAHGTMGGQPLRESFSSKPAQTVLVPFSAVFSPTLDFELTPLEAQPSGIDSTGHLPAAKATPSAYGGVPSTTYKTNKLTFGLFSVPVATARTAAFVAIGLVLATLLALVTLARPRRRDEVAEIKARYGRWMIPVARVWQEPGVAVIDVNDMDALVHIAERYDRAILHEHDEEEGDAFWVTDESGQYRYAVQSVPVAHRPLEQELVVEVPHPAQSAAVAAAEPTAQSDASPEPATEEHDTAAD